MITTVPAQRTVRSFRREYQRHQHGSPPETRTAEPVITSTLNYAAGTDGDTELQQRRRK